MQINIKSTGATQGVSFKDSLTSHQGKISICASFSMMLDCVKP